MKNALFSFVANFSGLLITLVLGTGSMLRGAVDTVFVSVARFLSWVGRGILALIDRDQYMYRAALTEQAHELGAIKLMAAASEVRDSALKMRVWTPQHTMAINRIAKQLHVGCNWKPSDVHSYMRSVVEEVPGLSYSAPEEEEST